jgi:hypothetical protein
MVPLPRVLDEICILARLLMSNVGVGVTHDGGTNVVNGIMADFHTPFVPGK